MVSRFNGINYPGKKGGYWLDAVGKVIQLENYVHTKLVSSITSVSYINDCITV